MSWLVMLRFLQGGADDTGVRVELPCRSEQLLPMALLRHELPDGSGHFDWLLAVNLRPGNEERSVVCLRTLVPPWPAPAREAILSLERVADHRGLYLCLTAPRELDERGIAHPVMRGNWRRIGAENRLMIQAHWSDGSGAVWLFNHALSQATCADLLG